MAVILLVVVVGGTAYVQSHGARQKRQAALDVGAIVFVRTPDRKRLIARVIARGPSHFWIELAPGDARWWVPATAVEPAPARVVEQAMKRDRVSRVSARAQSGVRFSGGRGREWA